MAAINYINGNYKLFFFSLQQKSKILLEIQKLKICKLNCLHIDWSNNLNEMREKKIFFLLTTNICIFLKIIET